MESHPSPLHDALDPALQLPREYGAYTTSIDPLSVRYLRVSREWPDYVKRCPFAVCGGDWDRAAVGRRPFREEQMQQLFVRGLPYRETDRYHQMLQELQQQGHTRSPRCASVTEIDAYFDRLLALYQSIVREGYRKRVPGDVGAGEITVRIGREGGFIKCGQGTHRLAIARILRLPAVPVVVDLMHEDWVRAQIQATRLSPQLAIQQALSVGGPGTDAAIR